VNCVGGKEQNGFGPAEPVKSRALVCTLGREFASFVPVYCEDVFDGDVQNRR
jgi:hypothetical protein